jgi:hypothetical protein
MEAKRIEYAFGFDAFMEANRIEIISVRRFPSWTMSDKLLSKCQISAVHAIPSKQEASFGTKRFLPFFWQL